MINETELINTLKEFVIIDDRFANATNQLVISNNQLVRDVSALQNGIDGLFLLIFITMVIFALCAIALLALRFYSKKDSTPLKDVGPVKQPKASIDGEKGKKEKKVIPYTKQEKSTKPNSALDFLKKKQTVITDDQKKALELAKTSPGEALDLLKAKQGIITADQMQAIDMASEE